MTSLVPPNCRRCQCCIYPRGHRRPGAIEHAARGLCRACLRAAVKANALEKYPPISAGPRAGRPQSQFAAEDFAFIVESDGGTRTNTAIGWDKQTRAHIAHRLKITPGALDKALYRDMRRNAA